ncbi:hypothetical protein TIFTF001_022005 [Ficus carica]|uniref:F-box domain-containing protein n=1 Tax=Ficus carica TaxID=3494 RepID=A0AA88AVC7_FICCA|nr:hypothetical protein TIFTF001_022005 [Ficus carica]
MPKRPFPAPRYRDRNPFEFPSKVSNAIQVRVKKMVFSDHGQFSLHHHPPSAILLLRDESEIVDIDITYMRADRSKAFIVHDMNDPNHKFIDGDSSINSGFNPRNKDYKVVTIATFYSAGQRKIVVHVFSLKSNCWREVKPYPRLTACLSSANVELNGVLYWSVFEINGILSFDSSDEEFREVDIPRSLKSGAYLIRELVKWERKSLAVIVWKVSAPFLDTWFWLGVWKDRILMVRRDRGRDHDDGDLLSYDLSDGEKRLIPLGKDANHSWHLKTALDYVESLVSVYPERTVVLAERKLTVLRLCCRAMSKEKRMESEYQSGRSLPEDLEKKILLKLPVRSLIQFKCVSKKWSSLITADSLFITSHLEHQHQFNSSTLLFLKPKTSRFDLFNQNCTPARLMFLRDKSNAVELDTSHILTPIYDRELYIYDMTVFRFDPHNKDYKLLRMAKITDYSHLDDVKKRILVHVFSLKGNCWSEVKPYPRLGSCLPSSYVEAFNQKSSCVELNGVLYWLNVISDDILSFEIDGILSFDLGSGIFGEVDTPRQCQCIRELVKWEGKSLAVIVQNFPLNEFECWAMQENDLSGGSKPTWTKQWTSGTPSVGRWCWEDPATFRVNRDEHGNMESSSLDVPREEDDMSCWQVENTFEYVESLVSVHPEQ